MILLEIVSYSVTTDRLELKCVDFCELLCEHGSTEEVKLLRALRDVGTS
jgi:hypothetical protein